MMNDESKNLADVIYGGVQLLLVIGGAWWAYYRFLRERSHKRRIEFQIECAFLGPHTGEYLAEFRLIATNKGMVIHKFRSIELRIRGITKDNPLRLWKGREPRVEFPEKLLQAEVVHQRYGYIFVEPGVEQVITYVTKIPDKYRFISARAEFRYIKDMPHSAERVFELNNEGPTS